MINKFCDPTKFEAISKDMRKYFENKRQQNKDWVLNLTKGNNVKNDYIGLCVFVKEYKRFGTITHQCNDGMYVVLIDFDECCFYNIYYDEQEVLFGLGL